MRAGWTGVLFAIGLVSEAGAAVFTVTSTADSGMGTLRNAITAANATAEADTITFNLGSNPPAIVLNGELPIITQPLTIDGYTQTGSSRNTLTNGSNAVLAVEVTTPPSVFAPSYAIRIQAADCAVRGLVVNVFTHAVSIEAPATRTTVEGNFFGTDRAGTTGLDSTGVGHGTNVLVYGGTNSTIGGSTLGARNVIMGQVQVSLPGATGNRIENNVIGLDRTGTTKLGATSEAVVVDGPMTTVIDNVIAGSPGAGIRVRANGTTIVGNLIGTDAGGTVAIGNDFDGIIVDLSSEDTVIGGTAKGAGNVIGASLKSGIIIAGVSTRTVVQNNAIGVDRGGSVALGNTEGGIAVIGGAFDTTITGNTIANNQEGGVLFSPDAGAPTAILGNVIRDNVGLGIDFGGDGITPNDAGDGDIGVNGLGFQNFPVLTSALGGCGGPTTIAGTLDAMPGTYRLEFFANPTCDPSGAGEGARFLGSTTITASGGVQSFSATVGGSADPGQVVTATASAEGVETSEFSLCFTIGPPPCTVEGCADGDPCTQDGCSGAGIGCCLHDQRTGFDSATCIFDEGGFDALACQGETLPRGVTKRFGKAQALLQKARDIGSGKRAKRRATRAAKTLGGGIPVANKAVKKHKLSSGCRDALVLFLTDGQTRAEALAGTL
ncbi:MAG TPA: right-handed parallel beta-helix repeat-containing protein [Candidatus Eisenbacteria bacterium]|nr:right-handed parallel beta-helix repeat-containing protein [Candidatus Eisenbacteria bacterium]